MSGAVPPLPNTPSWRGAQLNKKHRDNFTFTSTLKYFWNLLGAWTCVSEHERQKVKLYLHLTKHHARWKWAVSFKPLSFYPHGKGLRYPLNRRLAGVQSRSGRGDEEKNSQLPPGIEPLNLDRPDRSQSPYRLRYSERKIEFCFNRTF
jgi:hypothetical protein